MKIFVTGSTDGLGKLAAKSLLQAGHNVILQARNEKRKQDIMSEITNAEVLVADLSSIEQTKQLADKLNKMGKFDAIIHNAGVYSTSQETIAKVNVLAPYIITSMVERPERLIFVSSGLHSSGRANVDQLGKGISYSDSKLLLVMFCMTIARKWPDVCSNCINPGWVPTKMGGKGAPDDLQKGYETQVWLATSGDERAKVRGQYFFHMQNRDYNRLADDEQLQEKLLQVCEDLTGVQFPDN